MHEVPSINIERVSPSHDPSRLSKTRGVRLEEWTRRLSHTRWVRKRSRLTLETRNLVVLSAIYVCIACLGIP